GSSSVDQAAKPPDLRAGKKAFVAELKQKQLTFRWVACGRNGRTYPHPPIVRCNVNFGMDPHAGAYCTILQGGRPVTDHENKALPCGHDDAGFSVRVKGS